MCRRLLGCEEAAAEAVRTAFAAVDIDASRRIGDDLRRAAVRFALQQDRPDSSIDIASVVPVFTDEGRFARRPAPWTADQVDGQRVRQIVERLPAEHRIAFILSDAEGRGLREVAGLLDVPEGTARQWVHEARFAVQALLNDDRACAEEVLVDRLVAGDERAFEVLVRKHGGRMMAIARRLLRDEQEAKDAVQEALLAAHRHIATFSRGAPLGAWLRRIVINQALLRIRARERKREVSLDDLLPVFDGTGIHVRSPQSWEASADRTMERSELRRLVRQQIDRLPEKYRTALMLRDIEELSTREAAKVLGISEVCMKVRLHRARQALKSLLEPHLIAEEDGAVE